MCDKTASFGNGNSNHSGYGIASKKVLRIMGENIVLTKKEAIDILREIEFVLISLHKIGSAYAKSIDDQLTDDEYDLYCKSTTEFIDNSDVMGKLSFVRSIMSDKFSGELGNDDMDDIERAMQDIVYWPFN